MIVMEENGKVITEIKTELWDTQGKINLNKIFYSILLTNGRELKRDKVG